MDNIAHGLFGLFIAILVADRLKFKEKKWPLIIGVIAAEIPDIDFVIRIFGAGFYLVHHRELSHSILGIIGLSLLIAFVISRWKGEFWKYFALSLFGTLSHIFLDVITSFGTQVLYPFSSTRFSFSLVPIIDIYVWLIFFLGALFLHLQRDSWVKIAKATLFVFFVFLLFKSGLNIHANAKVAAIDDFKDVTVYPSFLSPFSWRAVVNEPSYYLVTDFDVTKGGTGPLKIYSKVSNEKIEASKKSLLVQQFLEFAHFPYAFVEGDKVLWTDLRFNYNGRGIGAEVTLYQDLEITSQKLNF